MTCVFAPLAERTTGSWHPVAKHPISTWATQWLTPTSGTSSARASDRAAVATVLRQGPRPGPCENAIPVICPGSLRTSLRRSRITDAWCWAASRGWMPPCAGLYGREARERRSWSKRAALRFHAVPSIPSICPKTGIGSYFLNSVYPHLPQVVRSLWSAIMKPGPQRGQYFFAVVTLVSSTLKKAPLLGPFAAAFLAAIVMPLLLPWVWAFRALPGAGVRSCSSSLHCRRCVRNRLFQFCQNCPAAYQVLS